MFTPVEYHQDNDTATRTEDANHVSFFEMEAYGRVLKVRWTEKWLVECVLQKLVWHSNLMNLLYFEHITRKARYLVNDIVERLTLSSRACERSKMTWMDNFTSWIG